MSVESKVKSQCTSDLASIMAWLKLAWNTKKSNEPVEEGTPPEGTKKLLKQALQPQNRLATNAWKLVTAEEQLEDKAKKNLRSHAKALENALHSQHLQ